MRSLRRVVTVIFLLACTAASAQNTIEELREQMHRDQQQLNATNVLLGKTRDNILLSERDLKLVQNNILTRRKLVKNLDSQISIITAEINTNARQVRELGEQLDKLKKEYGDFVYASWKNHKMNNAVAFLFASRDFNDATRRIAHMRRYNQMREQKGAEIDSLNYILQYEIEKLNKQKAELDDSRKQKDEEVNALAKEEKQHTTALENLQSNRKKLEAQAKEQQRKIANAQKKIDKIIAEQTKAGKTGRSQAQIESDIKLSGKFEDNKGKLPWPVAGGSVLDRFGKHAVSSQRGITNDFKGINIAAPKGVKVSAVFEGEVTGVYNIDHFSHCVMVRSGSYIIVYANLGRASVKTGDKIALHQEIGRISDSDNADQHMLIFQIWRETTPVDPEQWLRK